MVTPQSNQPRRALLLTGASRGIGHATVKRFSAAGWRVITCSRHPFPENCPWEMGPEDHIQVDLADPAGTVAAIAEIKERLENGELHALVNNAAISPKGPKGERLGTLESSQDLWRQVFEVNLFSTIWLAQGLKNELAKAHGAIVNDGFGIPARHVPPWILSDALFVDAAQQFDQLGNCFLGLGAITGSRVNGN
jgi:NAD(P)-dependent dehydrogenase (short-subunit alcohol dehydrogenase family)